MMSHNSNKKALSHEDGYAKTPMGEVVLINMPFTALSAPSIALGLLKSGLTRVGVSSRSLHFHLRFAELLGQNTYALIEEITHPEHLVREWIFSESLFQHPKTKDLDGYR